VTIPSLASGESVTLTLTFNVTITNTSLRNVTINNTAQAAVPETGPLKPEITWKDPNPENNDDSVSTTVRETPEADIAVSKSTADEKAMEGENVTYALTVTNLGPEGATNVGITDDWNLPTGSASVVDVKEVSETKKGIEWTEFDGEVSIIITSLDPGERAEIWVTLRVPNGSAGGNLTNIARHEPSAEYSDPVPENDESEETETRIDERRVSDISVTKSGPERIGEGNVTYTINVTNHGPDEAKNVTLVEELDVSAGVDNPTPWVIEEITPSSYWDRDQFSEPGQAFVTIPSLAAGESVTIEVTANITVNDSLASATVENRAYYLDGYVIESSPENNEDSVSTTVEETPVADIAVTKTGPEHASMGETATYTINVTNHGPDKARDVTVLEALYAPEGVEPKIVALTPSKGTVVGNDSVGNDRFKYIEIPSLSPGETVTITVDVRLELTDLSLPNATITNLAGVPETDENDLPLDPPYEDPNPENSDATVGGNQSLETEFTRPVADITVNKAGAENATSGQNITYTVTVTNQGPDTATDVKIIEIPKLQSSSSGELVPVAHSATSGSIAHDIANRPAGVTWTIPELEPGETATLELTIQPRDVSNATEIDNFAGAESFPENYVDPVEENGGDNVTTVVEPVPTADVSIEKTGPANALEGRNFTYTINITNHGPGEAREVRWVDHLSDRATGGAPKGDFEIVDVSAEKGKIFDIIDDEVYHGRIPQLDPGETVTVTVTFRVENITTDIGLENGVLIESNETVSSDPVTGNNTANVTTTIHSEEGHADISVRKTGPENATIGTNATHTITVHNNGPGEATGITVVENWSVTDGTIRRVVVENASTDGIEWTRVDSKLRITIATLSPGETATIEVSIGVKNVTDNATLLNTAGLQESVNFSDPFPNNDEARTTTGFERGTADVSVTKSGPGNVTEGKNATYAVNITNHGPDVATDVDIREAVRFPYGGFRVSGWISVSKGSIRDTGSFRWQWHVPRLAPGETATMKLTVKPHYATAWNGSIRNDVSVLPEPVYRDTDRTNNDDSVPTNVTIPEFSDQPDGWSSDIATSSGGDIYDWQLANMVDMWIAEPGYANLVFFQTQCYSGGILDDLSDELAGTGDVALLGSARHDQVAWADGSESHWAEEVADELERTGPNAPDMGELAKRARRQDEAGPYGPHAGGVTTVDGSLLNEHPQTKFLGNGSEIEIGKHANGSAVSSKHAVLFIGDAEKRHWTNLDRVYDALTNQHGFAPENVHVLADAGPGSPRAPGYVDDPGTKQALFETLRTLSAEMNSGEQLVFWTDNHGTRDRYEHGLLESITGPDRVTIPPTRSASSTPDVPVVASETVAWDVDRAFIDDVRSDPENVPFVSVIVEPRNASEGFEQAITNYTLYLNSEPLAAGTVEPIYSFDSNPDLDGYEVIYPVRNESILRIDNVVEGEWNGSRAGFEPFDVRGLHISTGAIDERVRNDTPRPTADIEVNKTGPASATSGENVTYTVTVTNHGPDTATDVVIKESFVTSGGPDGNIEVEFVERTVPEGTVREIGANATNGHATGAAFLEIPELEPGETVTISLTLRIRIPNQSRTNTTVLNSARVAENDENGTPIDYPWTDPNHENNDGDGDGSTETGITKSTRTATPTATSTEPVIVSPGQSGLGVIAMVTALLAILLFTRRRMRV